MLIQTLRRAVVSTSLAIIKVISYAFLYANILERTPFGYRLLFRNYLFTVKPCLPDTALFTYAVMLPLPSTLFSLEHAIMKVDRVGKLFLETHLAI